MGLPLADPWLLAVRARRLAARAGARRALVVVVAVATGLTAASMVRAAEQARDRWGATRWVAVARRNLAAGDVVDGAAVELRELPEAAVAATALGEVPGGAVVRQPVTAGEPLTEDRIAPDGLTGVAALVPAGHRAISIPAGPVGVPPVAVGDLVDVLAVLPPAGDIHGHGDGIEAVGQPAAPVVDRATVVDVRDEAIAIAVPSGDAPSVAAVLAQGVIVLTLAGA